jgi:hypothetical protein
MNDKLVIKAGPLWMPKEEYDKWQVFYKQRQNEFWDYMLWGKKPHWWEDPTPEKIQRSRVKLAYVTVQEDGLPVRKMIGVDNVTGEGFELEENVPAIKEPLVPFIKPFTMDRWCRPMDV